MAKASHLPPMHTVLSPANPSKRTSICSPPIHPPLQSSSRQHGHRRRVSLPAVVPINVDYLEREFGGHGASFRGIGDSCVVRMGLDGGSTASLMLPGGLITSYKPQMWHGSAVEVLQTSVSEGGDGEVVIQGGVSLGLECASGGEEELWVPRTWSLRDVRGSPESSIQVELMSVDPEGRAEVKYLVTLHQDILGSEVTITNLRCSSLCLVGSVISHLKVSTPDATYAVGLQGSNYYNLPPMRSDFSIIPPGFSRKVTSSTGQSWGQKALQGLFPGWGKRAGKDVEAQSRGEEAEESEGEEDDNYYQMTEKMSRIYTNAPREFTVIDRGRRNSVVVERRGFDEFYVFSPGSDNEWYGKYAYVCTGPSAILAPVILGPQGVWRGAQYLHNPNM